MGIISNAIEVDYQAAVRKSNELDELADDLIRAVNKNMDDTEQILRNGWKGDASNEYMRKHMLIQRKLLKHAKALKTEASQLRRIADNIKRIEDFGIGLIK